MFKKNKNLILFALLIVAIGFTYWFEERGNDNALKLENKRTEVLNTEHLGELVGVKGLKIDFVKKGDAYYARADDVQIDILLAKARLDEFFKILGSLKVKTFLQDSDVNKVGRAFYIPDDALKMTFQFEKGEVTFTLGKKLDFDQTFYMEITQEGKKHIVIVKDESPDPGVYKTDQEYQRSEVKYKRLTMVFMLTNVYFYDTRLFKDLYTDEKIINFDEITISTFRNKKYSIDFKRTLTNPPAPKGIVYFEENWISFHRTLTHMQGRTVIATYEPSALSEILSQFEVKDRSGRNYTLTLYKKFGEQNGYFLSSSLDKLLYILKPEDARLFFVNVQDFWKKSILPDLKEYVLGITFYDRNTDQVKVIDRELFKVESLKQGPVTRPLEFKKLIDFLKTEGDHVSVLTEKPSEILKKNIMRLNFDNRVMSVILEDNDAILVDLDLKIKIHHYVGATLPFSIKRSDYFEGTK
ncbi:MAG: hypothetical protein H7281_07110 [Bacteriovorax sp.]|nr:hypothetical protein [Bacteriovorax sp.]